MSSDTPHMTIGEDGAVVEIEETWEYLDSITKDAYGTAVVPMTLGAELVRIEPIRMGEGKSETITFRIPKDMQYHLSLLVSMKECPYDRVSDLARDGAILLGRYIVNLLRFKDPQLYSYFEGTVAASRARHLAEIDAMVATFAHGMRDTLLEHIADEAYGQAKNLLMANWKMAIEMPDEYHRSRYLSVFPAYPSIRIALRLCMEHGEEFPPELVATVNATAKGVATV